MVNAQITKDIFANKEQGAKRDIILLNASYALFANGSVRDITEGIARAKEALESGKALSHLEKMARLSQKLKA